MLADDSIAAPSGCPLCARAAFLAKALPPMLTLLAALMALAGALFLQGRKAAQRKLGTGKPGSR